MINILNFFHILADAIDAVGDEVFNIRQIIPPGVNQEGGGLHLVV